MAKTNCSSPEAFLRSLLSEEDINAAARSVGFRKRTGKIHAVAMVVAAVLSVCGREGQCIAAMRRIFMLRTDVKVARSAFYSRLSTAFEALLGRLLDNLQRTAAAREVENCGLLRGFRDVVVVDSTVVKVRDGLARIWKGTRKTRLAALKVHTWIRAVSGELLKHRITAEAYGDCRAFGITWLHRGVLFLLDRGYASPSLWLHIDRVGAFVLTRLPASHKPTIIEVNRTHRGRSRKLVGRLVGDAIKGLKRGILDVNCEFNVHIRGYAGKHGRYEKRVFRVIGIYNVDTRCHHLYVTNLPPSRLNAGHAAHIYRLRWEVETFYKVNKSGLGLDELTSAKAHIVKIQVMAALLRSSLAMMSKRQAEAHLPADRWINPMAWTQVWILYFDRLVEKCLGGFHRALGHSWHHLVAMTLDPELKRPPTRHWITNESFCDYVGVEA